MKSAAFSSKVPFKNYLVSILLTFVISVLLMSAFSLLITFVDISSALRNIFLAGISIFSAFLSGFFASRKTNRLGYLTGIIASVLYWGILLLVSFALGYASFSLSHIFKTLLKAIPFGILGGIMGINSK